MQLDHERLDVYQVSLHCIEELRRFVRREGFDDRLEIENPGLLPFGLTIDDLPPGVSKLRNREIGTVLQDPRRRYFLAERGPV